MSIDLGKSEARSDHRLKVRLSDLMIALSLASDLGMGQPLGWGLRACLLATHFAKGLELSDRERSDLYYLSLLHYLGCTTDAHLFAQLFGNDLRVMQQFALSHMGSYRGVGLEVLPLTPSRPVPPDTFRDSARARRQLDTDWQAQRITSLN